MKKDKPSEDKCPECKKRRDDGYVYCVCGNKLWESNGITVNFKGRGWGCRP